MTDRELLEAAAKACGIALEWNDKGESGYWGEWRGLPQWIEWDPLNDDGDALRLAVKLRLDIVWTRDVRDRVVAMLPGNVAWGENSASDPIAATRRAIVRVAAEVGRSMP